MTTTETVVIRRPEIYVACLSAYNRGKQHGVWIRCDLGENHIERKIKKMLQASPIVGAEEWAIHDYENFGNLKPSEFENLKVIAEAGEFITEHGELGLELLEHCGGFDHIEEAKIILKEKYQGAFSTLADWGVQTLETGGELEFMGNLKKFFNHEAYAKDCLLKREIFVLHLKNQIHIFASY